ncbi:MAG TPA: diaminobutyrate acetyltransferase [Moraxellaceae bacterium]|nr:diaminobutyrate acetyltransferase [Moraxellaceae bacterium]
MSLSAHGRAAAGPGMPWQLRPPDPGDGAAIHALVRRSPPLDLNSLYAYLLQGLHFAGTCVLAEQHGQPCGYVSAYLPPGRPDTLFVWQVAVAASHRGQGLGRAMLEHLLARPACRGVSWLDTTVSPANLASTRLFQGLARDLRCPCTVSDLFSPGDFGASGHEAEQLFRLGPFALPPASSHKEEHPHGHVHLRAP